MIEFKTTGLIAKMDNPKGAKFSESDVNALVMRIADDFEKQCFKHLEMILIDYRGFQKPTSWPVKGKIDYTTSGCVVTGICA